jgi:integrase
MLSSRQRRPIFSADCEPSAHPRRQCGALLAGAACLHLLDLDERGSSTVRATRKPQPPARAQPRRYATTWPGSACASRTASSCALGLRRGGRFGVDRLQQRADEAWTAAKLQRLTLHDCRHTFASFAIAAGVNAKALSSCMGHSSVAITLDRYGHLMPGKEAEAATLLDAYLAAVP